MIVVFQVRGLCVAVRRGPITAAVNVPGRPILAGDHRRRDRPTVCVFSRSIKDREAGATRQSTLSALDY